MNFEHQEDLWEGTSPLEQVAEFHTVFDCPIADNVIGQKVLASDLAFNRMAFMQEEMDEMWEAIRNNDPIEFCDAVVDLLYFTYGTALALGIPLEACFEEVHRSNMAKVGPDGVVQRDPVTGKIKKPDGWTAPDLGEVLLDAAINDRLVGL